MKKTVVTSFFILLISGVWAQNTNINFPAVQGKTLNNGLVSLSDSTKGRFSLIGLVMSKKAEAMMNKWYQSAYNNFMQQATGNYIPVEKYDINVFFMPVISGYKAIPRETIIKEIKKSVQADMQKHILVIDSDFSSQMNTLGIKDKDIPYFYVLDKSGKIVKVASGEFSQTKMDEILESLESE